MGKTIDDAHCQCLLQEVVSFAILDLIGGFIFFILMRWVETKLENLPLFFPALLLQFLLSYFLDKLCPKYIMLILSSIYISVCKSMLPNGTSKIVLPLVTRNRVNANIYIILACLLISSCFVLILVNTYYLKYLGFSGDDEIDIKMMSISRDELKTVMEKLCQFSDEEGEELGEHMVGYQFVVLFENFEPTFDEINEVFSIFDQDRDGFIDASDLQIVLINLGLQGGTDLNTCQHMIEQHDRGGEGKINSTDFVRLLEISLL